MKTFLIISLSLAGFFSLVIAGLVFLFFYQGGCCIRRIKNKITKKDIKPPILKGSSS